MHSGQANLISNVRSIIFLKPLATGESKPFGCKA